MGYVRYRQMRAHFLLCYMHFIISVRAIILCLPLGIVFKTSIGTVTMEYKMEQNKLKKLEHSVVLDKNKEHGDLGKLQ